MAGSIAVLEKKYIVIKREDADKYLNDTNRAYLNRLQSFIAHGRVGDGKPCSNEYVVLNMDDTFKVSVFYKEMAKVVGEHPRKVKDYAVALVNTILYSKK